MAWTNPTTQSTGTLITATIWNTDIVDNLTALRSGSVALTSQATGDVIYASSSTQLGRVAIGSSGYVLTSNGSAPAWSNTPTLTGTNFTGIPESGITDGTILARLAANETITGAWSFTGDLSLAATKKLYLDGGGDTYITESSANRIAFVSGGTEMFVVNSGVPINLSKEALGVEATKKLYLDGGGDTYIQENSGNQLTVVAGGAEGINITSAGIWKTTWSTTASAANAFVGDGNYLLRSTSSIRYKHDIDTLDADHALSAVMAMRPVTYRGKTDEDQRRHVGFIAEEVAEIAPLLATYDEGGETGTPNYVTYDRVTAYLVAVVQKQQAEIDALKARIQ